MPLALSACLPYTHMKLCHTCFCGCCIVYSSHILQKKKKTSGPAVAPTFIHWHSQSSQSTESRTCLPEFLNMGLIWGALHGIPCPTVLNPESRLLWPLTVPKYPLEPCLEHDNDPNKWGKHAERMHLQIDLVTKMQNFNKLWETLYYFSAIVMKIREKPLEIAKKFF